MLQLRIFLGFLFLLLPLTSLGAADLSPGGPTSPVEEAKTFRLGGELKFVGAVSWPENGTFLQPQGNQAFYDGSADLRLKGQVFFADWGSLDVHNLIGIIGGDTRKAVQSLQTTLPGLVTGDLGTAPPSDQRQLVNLTWTLAETNEYSSYDRLDRLSLTLQKDGGMLRLGRQAVTWGNGLLFNPMDLVNPFSPTDVVREYKVGQDMAFAQIAGPTWGNLQLAYVPRRNPDTSRVEWDESTLAGKFHFALGKAELDLLAAVDLGDPVAGIGAAGYLGPAAWRLDATWTFLRGNGNGGGTGDRDGYLSLVANVDTSWTWGGKNWYGFLEFFYNGLGQDDYSSALNDPDLSKRLTRGEVFTLGRYYLATHLRFELHPLVNTYLTLISNLHDPSGVTQPRVTWDVTRSLKLTIWGNIFIGRQGTEYGGFIVQGTNLKREPSNSVLAWLSFYF